MNIFQTIIAENYSNGDFYGVTTEKQAAKVGDSLFTFLIREFSIDEGCIDLETALSRIDTITNDMLVIQNKLEDL